MEQHDERNEVHREDWRFFWEWVENAMLDYERRTGDDMSYRKAERLAGLSNAAVSARARDGLRPTDATFEALAAALGMQKRELMEVAGVIEPPEAAAGTTFREILEVVRKMSPDDREHVLKYLQFQYPKAAKLAGQTSLAVSPDQGDDV